MSPDESPGRPVGSSPPSVEPELAVCGVCHEDVEDSVSSSCGHPFCRACISDYIEAAAVGGGRQH